MIGKILIRTVDGEPMMSSDALALFFGVDVGEVERQLIADPVLPVAWLKAGRRRASEAAAATGSRDVLAALRYWAAEHGMAVVEVDE